MKLTENESSVLRLVCDAIFPSLDGSPMYSASASGLGVDRLFAQAFESSLQPKNAEDLARVLSIIDSPLYNLVLTGRPVRFSRLSERGRERYLSAWRDSPVPLKRTAFQAFKRLTCFLAYATDEVEGGNPTWSEIGYPGPGMGERAFLPPESRLEPVLLQGDVRLECDVVIVGSGAGGSAIAQSLAASGLDVIVVEQGAYDTSETFKQSELPMMQKLFQQSGTAATKDLSFVLLAGRGAGGGTTVNWNTCLKPPARVLSEWEEEFGLDGVTGPEFKKHLDDVWRTIGVNSAESQRNPNNLSLWDGCRALGYEEGKDFEVIKRNAVGCQERCDFCTFGCVFGCKQSTGLTYLPMAKRSGARFIFDARVDRIVVQDGEARGIVGSQKSGELGHQFEVKSKIVVAACGGIETPALLLRSGIKDPSIGRYLRLDPTIAVGGVFEKPIDPWKGPPQTVAVWKFIDLDGTYHGFWVEAAPAHPGLVALSVPWQGGKEHKDFMKNFYSHSTASIVLLRERSSGRVAIDRDGFPVVTYELGSADRETAMRGMEETGRILAAAGAVMLWTTHNDPVMVGDRSKPLTESDVDRFASGVRERGISPNKLMMFSAHLMGSCRMSADPSLGPTSPSGQLHSVKNLFIGDACVFPTTPAVNPMVSIMAMALRTAESIKAAFRGPG